LRKFIEWWSIDDFQIFREEQEITKRIISYLCLMRSNGLSFGHRNSVLAAIRHHYEMNDIMLNWKKIRMFLGERTATNDLRAYTHGEIGKLIMLADPMYRAIILTYSSTGMRREALVGVRLTDMQYLEEYKLYKIRVYSRTPHEHVCFTTPEAADAIRFYLSTYKRRIKDDFYFHRIQPKCVSGMLRKLVIQAGIGQYHPDVEGAHHGSYRDPVPCVHGLRKFCITQMAKAKVDPEVAKLLTDHTIGVRGHYLDYTDNDLLEEYLKAVDNLTISNEKRLQSENDELTKELDRTDVLERRMNELEAMLAARRKRKST
jgi:integrase